MLRNVLKICNLSVVAIAIFFIVWLYNSLTLFKNIQLNSIAETKLLLSIFACALFIFIVLLSFHSWAEKEYSKELLNIENIEESIFSLDKFSACLQRIDVSLNGYYLHVRRTGRKVYTDKMFLRRLDASLLSEILEIDNKLNLKFTDNSIEPNLLSLILNYYLEKEKGNIDNLPVRIESIYGRIIKIYKEGEEDINACN